jgi:hypothetical protein
MSKKIDFSKTRKKNSHFQIIFYEILLTECQSIVKFAGRTFSFIFTFFFNSFFYILIKYILYTKIKT